MTLMHIYWFLMYQIQKGHIMLWTVFVCCRHRQRTWSLHSQPKVGGMLIPVMYVSSHLYRLIHASASVSMLPSQYINFSTFVRHWKHWPQLPSYLLNTCTYDVNVCTCVQSSYYLAHMGVYACANTCTHIGVCMCVHSSYSAHIYIHQSMYMCAKE